MSVHTIRLAGPWQLESATDATFRTRLPIDCPRGARLCAARRFGRPGRLDVGERVWLVIDGLAGEAEILLNKVPLELVAGGDGLRGDITDGMVADNWLSIRWKGDESGGLAGPVWLEFVSG